ncbi:MAG: penicillin acylase family protein [candidate division KSB1 bacterium]|nr:penicillin acylase family protein [candidate division KSB1 bacterium]
MSRAIKWIIAVAAFLVIIASIVGYLGYRLVTRSLPDFSQPVVISGLNQPVRVYYDDYGVPHVYAENDSDLYRVVGYLCARDRMWQMEFFRRLVGGQLSEIFGDQLLKEDRFFRTLGFYRAAERIAAGLAPESRLALTMFTRGVNAYLDDYRDRLPVEFSILDFRPEPWDITDSIAFLRFMGFQLSFAWHSELVYSQVAARLGVRRARELFPGYESDAPTILAGATSWLPDAFAAVHGQFHRALRAAGWPPFIGASNSWVVSGAKSTSGKPILANDPHLGLSLPSVWYEMHLVSNTVDVAGVALPLVPGIVIGQNRAMAWGLTNGMVDDADFYIERLHPRDSTLYWDGRQWQKMQVVQEWIYSKDRDDPVPITVRITRHGPIVSDVHPAWPSDSLALAFRWTGYEVSDETAAFMKLNRANSWESFVDALRTFRTPCQNIIYADTAGTIGYYAAGAVPIRRDGGGFAVYRGWQREGDWLGMIPFERMPHAKNPPRGYIATANNLMQRDFPYYLGNGWEPDSRIRRITALLEEKERLSPEDFMRIQLDPVSEQARKTFPLLLDIVANASLSEDELKTVKLLQEWDFAETRESAAASVYHVWFVTLLEATLKDELGDTLFNEFRFWSNFPIRAIEYLVRHPESRWWDNDTTEQRESRDDVVLAGFRQTLAYLREHYGDGPGFWEWGRLHTLTLQHVLGQASPLDRVFNRGPFPMPGSASTVPKAEYSFQEPFAVKVGASVRQIVDLAEPDAGYRVLPGGQSGQPFSPHYDDQIELWLKGEYRRVRLHRSYIRQTASAMQRFVPSGE